METDLHPSKPETMSLYLQTLLASDAELVVDGVVAEPVQLAPEPVQVVVVVVVIVVVVVVVMVVVVVHLQNQKFLMNSELFWLSVVSLILQAKVECPHHLIHVTNSEIPSLFHLIELLVPDLLAESLISDSLKPVHWPP